MQILEQSEVLECKCHKAGGEDGVDCVKFISVFLTGYVCCVCL